RRVRTARECSGGFLPPSPPGEKTTASQDQAGQPGPGDWTRNAGVLGHPGQAYVVYKKPCAVEPGDVVFRHAYKLGLEGIVSKRLGSPYRSGRSRRWDKSKNPAAPAVKREAEEDWAR